MSDWFDDNDTQIDTGISKALLNYLPIGYELITTANDLRLYGDHSIDLMESLHLAGGHWDPDLLAYSLPLGRDAQLEHALKHFRYNTVLLILRLDQIYRSGTSYFHMKLLRSVVDIYQQQIVQS